MYNGFDVLRTLKISTTTFINKICEKYLSSWMHNFTTTEDRPTPLPSDPTWLKKFNVAIILSQIGHLTGITATCLFPGFLRGIEGLSRLVLGTTVLQEPMTLAGIVGRERPICRLAPLAVLGRTALLGGSFRASLVCALLGQ